MGKSLVEYVNVYDDGRFLGNMLLFQCAGLYLPVNGKKGCAKLPDGRYIVIHEREDGELCGIVYLSSELALAMIGQGTVNYILDNPVYAEIKKLLEISMTVREYMENGVPDCEEWAAAN
jgi:hypothetical protein